MKKFFVVFLTCFYSISGEDMIYNLNPQDYYRMPAKNHLDRLEPCLGLKAGVYCTAHADLVSDEPSELLHMIKAYSAHHRVNFNYSNIKYGLCITKTCRQFYDGDDREPALWNTTEACLNDSFSRDYDLKVRVTDLDCFWHDQPTYTTNTTDTLILAILGLILALNVAGNIYDWCFKDENTPGNRFLMMFSIRENWKRLTAPPSTNPDQVLLQSANGIRAMSSILVILGHIPIPVVNAMANHAEYESTYKTISHQVLHQGHLVPSTFYTMSGLLFAFSLEAQSEKHRLSWKVLPQALLFRWLRLSPANFVVLMLTAVWYKFIPAGPLFKEYIEWESTDCRKYWLYNVFYVSNMIDFSQCNLQVWYLATDMQLHMLALAVVVLSPSVRVRNWTLAALYLFGLGWPAYQVYLRDLDGIYLATPTITNKYFNTSETFNWFFKGLTHNIPSFVIGMAFGYLMYNLNKKNFFSGDFRKYRVAYWFICAALFAVEMTGGIFYGPERPSLFTRIIFMPFNKPVFSLIVNLILFGASCKCDDLVRGLLEWKGWMPIARLSYCTYLVHMLVLRFTGGTRDNLFYNSPFLTMQEYLGVVCMTLIFSCLMHLLVEAPFAGLVKMLTPTAKPAKPAKPAKDAKDAKEALALTEDNEEKTSDEFKTD